MRTSLAPHVQYPYEEFADHVKAMKMVREWEYTSRFGQVGRDQTSRANSARVLEYFSDSYADSAEALHKAELFLSVYDYIGRHAALFARKGLLQRSAEGVLEVEPALLRAVHYVFTVSERAAGFAPKGTLALARAFEEVTRLL